MSDAPDDVVRRAIGGDPSAIARVQREAATTESPIVAVMAALIVSDPNALVAAGRLARETRDRQLVEIARAHLTGDDARVSALARDHLVDFPDSIIVAWIAAGAGRDVPGSLRFGCP